MARIPILQDDDPALSDEGRTFLDEAGKARGKLINLYRAMANRPEAGRALAEMIRVVYRAGSTVPTQQAELAYLTATVVNNCYY